MGFTADFTKEWVHSMVRPGPFLCAIGHMEPGYGFASDVVARPLDQGDHVHFNQIVPGAVVTHYQLWDRRGAAVGTYPLVQAEAFHGGGTYDLTITFNIEGRSFSPKALYDTADTDWRVLDPGLVASTDEAQVARDRAARAPEPPSFANARPMAPVRPKELEA
jgi:hypothetical protein